MAKLNRPDQPAWQQNTIFEFFSSLKLAVVLLAVLIAGAIVGTLTNRVSTPKWRALMSMARHGLTLGS